MEEKEDKGFVVKDRRRVSQEESEQPEAAAGPQTAGEEERTAETQRGKASGREETRHIPLPEVSLATFVLSLSSSALVHLGEVPDPETQSVQVDLPLAKQVIDTLGMLQDKTRGNLDSDEERLLKTVLYDLRMRYVQKSGK
jgi:hypothetical protein